MDSKRASVDIIDPNAFVGASHDSGNTIDGLIDDLSKPETGSSEPPRHAGFQVIDPIDASLIDLGTPTERSGGANFDRGPATTKRRGRPQGSRNRDTSETLQKSAGGLIPDLEALLLSVHFMGAALLSVPELELDEDESKKLAKSIRNVAKHYSVSIDAKKMAMFELASTVVAIYGTRGIAIYKNHVVQAPAKPDNLRTMPAPPSKSDAAQTVNGQANLSPKMTIPRQDMAPSDLVGYSEPPIDSFNM